jgi:pyruvate dehydrogenase E2 component (dihydrolipoamide acetyltransferase)
MQHTIILPDLGQTTTEAKIVKWLKAVGEPVAAGESLLEVETDKATMEVEAYTGGYFRKKLVQEGQIVVAMSPIAILSDTLDEAIEEESQAPAPRDRAGRTAPTSGASSPSPLKGIAAAPAARLRAKELGVELSRVAGTGPNGLITQADVERYAREREK